eukprot:scaffold300_cov375-Prasinococcus_capsulatus_cf.AAC.3
MCQLSACRGPAAELSESLNSYARAVDLSKDELNGDTAGQDADFSLVEEHVATVAQSHEEACRSCEVGGYEDAWWRREEHISSLGRREACDHSGATPLLQHSAQEALDNSENLEPSDLEVFQSSCSLPPQPAPPCRICSAPKSVVTLNMRCRTRGSALQASDADEEDDAANFGLRFHAVSMPL